METVLTRTFPQTTQAERQRRCNKIGRGDGGFSLIELIVVVALISLISVFALPSITSYFQVSINSATRELASTVKETYNSAVITGKVHRLAYDLKSNSYWAESAKGDVLVDTKETLEKAERRKRMSKSDEAPASAFELEKTVTRRKISLPRGVLIEDVITQQSKEPIIDGMAYTHIFPHGITEQTMIHLKDTSNHRATLVLTPLIGQTDFYGRYVTPEEVFGK